MWRPRHRSKQKVTLNEVEAEALVYTCSHVLARAVQECYRHTDTLLGVELGTLGNTVADVMSEALIDALADTLGEGEAETLGKTLADDKAEAILHAVVDTVADVEAEALYETLSDMNAETLFEALDDTLPKDGGRHTW